MEVIVNGHTIFAINSALLLIIVVILMLVGVLRCASEDFEPLAQDFITLSKKLLEEKESDIENPLEEGVD